MACLAVHLLYDEQRPRRAHHSQEHTMATERWAIDASHSGIHFSVRHLVIAKVRGQFSRWSGALDVPDGDFTKATVDAVVDAASIETGVADRDAHLRSPDFFDVAQFPEIRFTATRFDPQGSVDGRLRGQLTIKGITRDVTLTVERHGETKDPWGNQRAAFSAKTSIDRKDFGLTWNQALETGGLMVGERVDLEIEIEAVRQAAEKVA
jgi:polyisoprenoid-binding protein YceI